VYLPDAGPHRISLYDLSGNRVLLHQSQNSQEVTVSIRNLPAGVYTLQVDAGGAKATRLLAVME
jgi:hypothetical protein